MIIASGVTFVDLWHDRASHIVYEKGVYDNGKISSRRLSNIFDINLSLGTPIGGNIVASFDGNRDVSAKFLRGDVFPVAKGGHSGFMLVSSNGNQPPSEKRQHQRKQGDWLGQDMARDIARKGDGGLWGLIVAALGFVVVWAGDALETNHKGWLRPCGVVLGGAGIGALGFGLLMFGFWL
jgi:hypothetical protein